MQYTSTDQIALAPHRPLPGHLRIPERRTAISDYNARIANTISDLHQLGFTEEFILLDNQIFCAQTQQFFNSSEFEIVAVYSFRDDSYDNEQSVIYAIGCLDNTIKGTLFQNASHSHRQDIVFKMLRKFWK